MNIVRHRTPDYGWAWVIALSCASINGLTFGLIRSFGVFFFYLRHDFDVSRQVASWPFALCTSFTYLSGSITGLLIIYFNLRTMVFVGILFASLGFSLCFFVTDIHQIVILIGFVFGFGIGLSFMQTPVILAQYFSKFHATATAISYAGGTVGSFIFPPLIEHFIASYGLKGSFLVIGAVLLNGLPFAMLLRPPIPGPSTSDSAHNSSQYQTLMPPRSIKLIYHKLSRKRNEKWFRLRKSSIDLFTEKLNSNVNMYSNVDRSSKMVLIPYDNYKIYNKQVRKMMDEYCELEMLLIESSSTSRNVACATGQMPTSCSDQSELDEQFSDNCRTSYGECSIQQQVLKKNKYCQTTPISKRSQFLHMILTTVTNPMYIILLITHVSFQWAYDLRLLFYVMRRDSIGNGWMTYQMVIFDFVIDQNLTRSQSLSILITFAIFDLFGRMTSGWVADKQIIKKNHIVSICILLIGFLILITSMITTYRHHLLLTSLLGFTCGAIIVLFNLLTMEYVGLDNLPIALGVSSFCVGVTSLFRPYVIGFFGDVIGSYSGLFQFVGILSLIAALLWLMEPFAILSVKRTSNKKGCVTNQNVAHH